MSPRNAPRERCSAYLLFAVLVVAFSGILYGYHTGIISGALIFLTPSFQLSIIDQGMLVSMVIFGGLFGALFAGVLADRIGRRRTIALTMVLFIGGAVIASLSNSYDTLLIGRLISGIGVGVVSLAAPLYLAEVSPPHFRGAFVALFQLCIALGILLSYAMSYCFAANADWRWMFAIGAFPAALEMLALFFLPETPAWLFSHGKGTLAVETMKRFRKDKGLIKQIEEMKTVDKPGKVGRWKDLFSPKLRFILLVGFILSALQQITGINAVVYFAPKIFGSAGFESASTAIFATICLGIVNVLATGLSAWLIDRVGRRVLLLIGVTGMTASLCCLCIAFFTQSSHIGLISIISLMSYIAFFAIGLGPITWVVLSEVFPLKIRGKAMTVALFINWACNYLISLSFLSLISALGSTGTFLIYAVISAIAIWFIYRFIPETRGKSLEEIERLVERRPV